MARIPGSHDPVALNWILRRERIILALDFIGRRLDGIDWRWPDGR